MQTLKKAIVIGLVLMTVVTAGCGIGVSSMKADGLIISEVVSSNSNSLIDPVLGKPDWIELVNMSQASINLADYSIAESGSNLYEFGDITIDAGAHMVIYCCKSVDEETLDTPCTGFKLSKSGTTLTLSSKNFRIQELEVPPLETDISYGITEDGVYRFFPTPTPSAPNTTPSFDTLEESQSDWTTALVINEVMPKSASETDEYAWVEIYNAGDEDIALGGFCITEDLTNPTKAKLPEMLLSAGEYAVVRFTDRSGEDEVPFKIGSNDTVLGLYNNFGQRIDSITWDPEILAGVSCAHGEGGLKYFVTPTPGQKNSEEFLEDVTVAQGVLDVRINEILLRNTFSSIDQDGERAAWVELYNTSNETISLSDYTLSDNGEKLLRWPLPDIALEPGAYQIVFLSGKDKSVDELHTNFKLGNGETQLFLTNVSAHTMQTLDLPKDVKDNISYGMDAQGQWLFYPQPTPSAANDTKGFQEIASNSAPGVIINEVVTVSKAKSRDTDWVELYNERDEDVDLSGYYLSDSSTNLMKWPITQTTIKTQGYAVIDEYKTEDDSGEIEISLSGETLYLTNAQGIVIDQFNTGVLRPGISRGIVNSEAGKMLAMFSAPTPGKPNGDDTLGGYAVAPFFSVDGGYQTAPVTLTMHTDTEGASIYYTTDGSTPTADDTKYTHPISISTSQTVRAIAIAKGKLNSEETVATYLFEEKHSLPVVCLSMTQRDLDYVFGSTERTDVRERGGYVEYYEPDGTLGVKFPAGFKIAGAGTRVHKQKSINLYLRGGYGKSEITYPFFDGFDITTFQSLSLRNMGQDYNSTRMRDAYFSSVVNGMTIDNMQSKFAVVYINGEYWGLYEFKENQNEDYFAGKYGIDTDDVQMVRSNYWTYVGGSNRNIKNLFSLAGRTSREEKFDEYLQLADSDYFTDYLIAVTYFSSTDMYNQKYAHTTDNIVKWRPVFYDLDVAFMYSHTSSAFDNYFRTEPIQLSEKLDANGQPIIGEDGLPERYFVDLGLYYGFYRNEAWREQFVERYAEVMNTILTKEKMLAHFDEMVAAVEDEMPRCIERWGTPSSMEKWRSEVATLRERIEKRRPYAIENLQKFFKLSDARIAELFPNG